MNNSNHIQLPLKLFIIFAIIFNYNCEVYGAEQIDTSKINSINRRAYKQAREEPDKSLSDAHTALKISKNTGFKKGIADSYLAIGAAYMTKYNPNDSASFYYNNALDLYTKLNDIAGMGRAAYGLSFLYNFKSQPEKATQLAKLSIECFEKTELQKELIAALGAMVYLQRKAGNNEEALSQSNKAIEAAHLTGDTLQWANALNDRGQIYKDMFLINQAIDSYFEAFKLWEQKGDSSGLAIAYGSIANAYHYQEDYRKSLEFNFKKLPIVKTNRNLWETNKTMNNIALSFSNLNMHDSALVYTKKSIKIAQQLNYPNALANDFDKMASIFLKMNEPDSALFYSFKAVSIAEKNNSPTLSAYLVTKANAIQKQERYSVALPIAKKAYDIAKEKKDSHTQRAATLLLNNIYYRLNKPERAYQYLAEYQKLNDSITNKEYMRKVTRLDIQYEFEKKQKTAEHEVKMLDIDNQLKSEKLRKSTIVLIAVLLLSFSGASISFLIIRNKNSRIEHMNLEIRNYLLQLDKLKAGSQNENPIGSLVKNYGLTQRESEIMELITTGIGNEEIAEKLFVSKNTIKFHIKNIFIKLDVRNRVQALQKMAG